MDSLQIGVSLRAAQLAALAWMTGCGSSVNVGETGGGGGGGAATTSSHVTASSSSTGGGGGSGGELAAQVEAQCPMSAGWQTVCVTIDYPTVLWAFELESGLSCQVGQFEGVEASGPNSMAVLGTSVHLCAGGLDAFYRLDVATWAAEETGFSCSSVTSYADKLLVLDPMGFGQVSLYDSFEDVVGHAAATVLPFTVNNSVLAASGETLLTAWHSTNELELYGLPSGSPYEVVPLEGFDDWVRGIALLGDRIAVLSSGYVATFTRDGGTLATLQLPFRSPGGLHCWTPGE
jgi:hypothetical protein